MGADDAGVVVAEFDVGEEIGVGLGLGLVAQGGEFGLDVGLALEAGAVAAGGVVVGVGEGVAIGVGGGGAGKEFVDEFAVAEGELHERRAAMTAMDEFPNWRRRPHSSEPLEEWAEYGRNGGGREAGNRAFDEGSAVKNCGRAASSQRESLNFRVVRHTNLPSCARARQIQRQAHTGNSCRFRNRLL